MLDRKYHKLLQAGDIVVTSEYTPDYPNISGVVLERKHYVSTKHTHPDEYSCLIKMLGSERIVRIRAKWLGLLSGAENV